MDQKILKAACAQIQNLWPALWRDFRNPSDPTLIAVPNPHLVPGGVFDEFYYWDSYFTMLGLADQKHEPLLRGMVDNFLFLFEKYQVVPNGNRSFYLNRSQPPFLAPMIKLVYELNHDRVWLKKAFDIAKQEYQKVWVEYHGTGSGLSRYWHSQHLKESNGSIIWEGKPGHEDQTPRDLHHLAVCESGWDYGPRFEGRCPDFNPVDLNCLLYLYEQIFGEFCCELNLFDEAKMWESKSKVRKGLINQYLWNEALGLYLDYDFVKQKSSRIKTSATFFPLWCGVASQAQAQRVFENLKLFEAPGGILTTDQSYAMEHVQWNYPVGWAPQQWVAIQGLERYGFHDAAQCVAQKWINCVAQVFQETGKFWECYNMLEGNLNFKHRYAVQEGFGWTNGVFLGLIAQYAD